MNSDFDWEDVDALITLLHAQGIFYLMGNGSSLRHDDAAVDLVRLVQRLAACEYPLIENASISLFLLHPECAPFIVEALQHSEEEIAETIAVLVLVTLYLQQWWFFRLTFAFGRLSTFPETPFVALWEGRSLPAPSEGYGFARVAGIADLSAAEVRHPLEFSGRLATAAGSSPCPGGGSST